MNDTKRLDAIGLHGFSVAEIRHYQAGSCTINWVCHFGIGQCVEGETIREVIDKAVHSIEGQTYAAEEGLQQENDQPEHCQREGIRQAN